jgi:F-type H+-transporting ATPase subunit b
MAENATHAAADAAHSAGPGMPQLDFATFPNQIFWLVVALVAIFLILSRIALPRIAAVLAERQGSLTNDLAAAEEFKQRAVEAEAAYNKALADARAEAQKIAEDTRASIQADLNDAIARADAEIATKATESAARMAEIKANAIRSIEEVASEIAGDIVGAVAPGQTVDQAAITAAIAARVKG